MWDIVIDQLSIVPQNISFVPILLVVYFITMLIFWYESKNTEKNRNSIFDMWFFTTLIMLIWGRIAFIITNWSDFTQWNWFWFPYERYGETMYVFRAMPWRLLRLWDGGFLFIPMFLAFLVAGFLFTVFVKKWRWRDMFMPVIFSANFFLGITLFFYGLYLDNSEILEDGVFIVIFTLGVQIVLIAIRHLYRFKKEAFKVVRQIVILLFMILNIWFLSYTFLSQDISQFEVYHVYTFIGFGILMMLAYLLDVRNPEKSKKSTIETVPNVSLNQSVKIKDEK